MKKIIAMLGAVFILNFCFAQEMEGEDETLNLDTPESVDQIVDLEADENKENGVDQSLQRNFNIQMASQNWNLDPHTAAYSSEAQILDSLYEGLFSYHPKTLDPVPAIAKSFKISRDKKRWTFTIREDAKFSNGEAINAFTVRNCWIELLKNQGAPYASLLDCIKNAEDFRNGKCSESDVGISARDDKTLVVSLRTPTAHLSKILCHHAFSVCRTAGGEEAFSGAFKIKERTEASLVLEKNPEYWDEKNVHLPQITISSSSDISENAWIFNTGRTDWVSGMVDTAKLINKNAVRISAIFGTEYLFFSCKNRPWNNAEFRNALLSAVPWSALRKQSLVQATTLIYPLAGYPAVEGLTDTSPEDALEMMKDARKALGYTENEKISITFGVSMTSERQQKQAELLKEAWEPLGVELKIQTTPEDRYIDSIPGWNADLFTYSWIGDFADPLAFLELFRGNSTLNQTKWNSEKFNKLLEEASNTTDNMEHYKLLSQAEQLLLDEGVILPVSHSISLHAVNLNNVGGWFVNALDIHPFKYLYIKEDKTESVPNVI
ncbi:MAG: peptide ABC transporter substrate-binding protein [Treponema sp.]|nr:peptide ABC transporter substrate-binding protein [Candidatus Treponema equifaecale]